jgi:hypothetical protein
MLILDTADAEDENSTLPNRPLSTMSDVIYINRTEESEGSEGIYQGTRGIGDGVAALLQDHNVTHLSLAVLGPGTYNTRYYATKWTCRQEGSQLT